MTRILHVADSYLGAQPYRSAEREDDLWRAFGCSVRAAIDLGADVYLHAGMLLSQFAALADVAPRLRDLLEALQDGGVVPLLAQGDSHDLGSLDVDLLLPGEAAVELRGMRFTNDLAHVPQAPTVLVAHGRVQGLGGYGVEEPPIDARALARSRCAYVALGGMARMQPVQPNAWYCGQTARVEFRDTYRVGGLLVDIGEHTGTIRSLQRVVWDDRPHLELTIDGRALGVDELGHVLDERMRDVATLGQAPPHEPVLLVRVLEPQAALDELFDDARFWAWHVRCGGPLYTEIRWGDERRFVPGEPS